jgi:acetate kinase
MGTTLTVNPGSSSKKYALYRDGVMVRELVFESANIGFESCTVKRGSQQTCAPITGPEFDNAFAIVAKECQDFCAAEGGVVDTIGIRIVAPGTAFQKNTVVDEAYLVLLREKEQLAPLHIPAVLREISESKKYFPKTRIIAASDSAFHSSLPFMAREFSLDRVDADTFDIRRFGYHGLSVASIVNRVHAVVGQDYERMVVCHIGSGVSVTAVKRGVSVETSMGYSPVSGIPMSCRASDLGADALLQLMREKKMKPSEATVYLNRHGGLSGVAGDSDIRHLLDRRSKGEAVATQTLDLFAYHIQKAVAASTVSLGGIDALIFTGTAGFRSAELRTLVTKNLQYLGVVIDEEKNDVLVGKEGAISNHTTPVKVVVMRTDEMREIARVAEQLNLV